LLAGSTALHILGGLGLIIGLVLGLVRGLVRSTSRGADRGGALGAVDKVTLVVFGLDRGNKLGNSQR
jgi:hypothetical protein